MNKQLIIHKIEKWLELFVIKYNICPFANKVHKNKNIHYAIVNSCKTEDCLNSVLTECYRLNKQTEIETTLIIFPYHLHNFIEFLEFVYLSEDLLTEYNFEGIYQLAHFHPLYCFEGEPPNDPTNYTNRSPYPILHLIREFNLEQTLKSYSNPENIPVKNYDLLKKMGLKKVEALFNKIK